MHLFKKIFHPEIYHGHDRKPPFFEGWYFKLFSADESQKTAVMPGVFLGGDGYAFIQVLEGNTAEVEFIKYPLGSFSAVADNFVISMEIMFFAWINSNWIFNVQAHVLSVN
jgi:hypothetical protein